MAKQWSLTGSILGDCNCDWGCPCNFNVAPTHGHCDGVYTWAVREGHYGETSLDGAIFAWGAHSPGPLHEGNLTGVWIVDESLSHDQQQAIETLNNGGGVGLPFDIFAAITSTKMET